MNLTNEEIQQLIELYYQFFKVRLTNKEAYKLGSDLVYLIKTSINIYKITQNGRKSTEKK